MGVVGFVGIVSFLFLERVIADEGFVNVGQKPIEVKGAKNESEMILAIVSTWRGHSDSWANSWLRYHIGIGFSRFYLFFDDPVADKDLIKSLSTTSEYKPFLTIIKVDNAYRKRFWTPDESKKSKDPEQLLLPRLGVYLKTDHTSRQQLNVARAGVMAKADGVNWLLHMDADELFWIERLKSGIARSFFKQLHNRKITHLTLINDEMIPLTAELDFKNRKKDPFHQRMHFKRNVMALDKPEDNELVQHYERSKGAAFFLGYMCGKGGINVELWKRIMGEGIPVIPENLCSFALSSWQPDNVTLINKDPGKRQRCISSEKVKIFVSTTVARVLHYVNPYFAALKKKFGQLKKFNGHIYDIAYVAESQKKEFEKWEEYWAQPVPMPSGVFYMEMWSSVQRTLQTKNDKYSLDFYIRAAMAPQKKELQKYLKKGVIYKNKDAYQFLKELDKLTSKQRKDKDELFLEISAGIKFVDGGSGKRKENRTYAVHECKEKGPHFFCDIDDCCGFISKSQFELYESLLSCQRYEKCNSGSRAFAGNNHNCMKEG
eukprot:gene13809-4738_t